MFKKFVVLLMALALVATVGTAKTKLVLWQFMMNDDTGSQVVAEFEKNPLIFCFK